MRNRQVFLVVEEVESGQHWHNITIMDAIREGQQWPRSILGEAYKLKKKGPAVGPSSRRFVVAFNHSHPINAPNRFPGPAR